MILPVCYCAEHDQPHVHLDPSEVVGAHYGALLVAERKRASPASLPEETSPDRYDDEMSRRVWDVPTTPSEPNGSAEG